MTGELLYAAGQHFNCLARGALSCSPVAATAFPVGKLADGDPFPFSFGSIAAASYVQLHNNVLANYSFEDPLGDEWADASSGGGTRARTPVDEGRGGAGTYGLRCNGGAGGVGAALQVVDVQAGESGRVDGYVRTGLGRTGSIRLRNRKTGKWLVGGAWQAAEGDAAAVTGSVAYQRVSLTLAEVEGYDACQAAELQLDLYCRTADNGDVDFDDVAWVPAVTGAALYDHNVSPRVAVTLRSSDDAFAADDVVRATLDPTQPSFYCALQSRVYREWWRLYFSGENDEEPYVGEGWVGQWRRLSKDQLAGWRVVRPPMTSVLGEPGSPYRVRLRDRAPWSVEMTFLRDDVDAPLSEFLLFMDLCGGGHWQTIVAPSQRDGERFLVLGHVDPDELTASRDRPVWRLPQVVVRGMDIPLRLP